MDRATVTTSWDDGHPLDLKLAELLSKYDIPATFYIPIFNTKDKCLNNQQIKEIAQCFDIGGHTYHHVHLPKVPPKEAKKEVVECKKRLEEIIGRNVLSFCFPYGDFNEEIINIVKCAGFIGARTVKLVARIMKDPFRMSTTVNARDWWFSHYVKHSLASQDPRLFGFMLKNNLFFKGWDRIAIETLGFVVNNGGIWHLWGHSWEVEQNNDWAKLERVFQEISRLSKQVINMNNSQLLKMSAENG